MSADFPIYTQIVNLGTSPTQPNIRPLNLPLEVTVVDRLGAVVDIFNDDGTPITQPLIVPATDKGRFKFKAQTVNDLVVTAVEPTSGATIRLDKNASAQGISSGGTGGSGVTINGELEIDSNGNDTLVLRDGTNFDPLMEVSTELDSYSGDSSILFSLGDTQVFNVQPFFGGGFQNPVMSSQVRLEQQDIEDKSPNGFASVQDVFESARIHGTGSNMNWANQSDRDGNGSIVRLDDFTPNTVLGIKNFDFSYSVYGPDDYTGSHTITVNPNSEVQIMNGRSLTVTAGVWLDLFYNSSRNVWIVK